MFGVVGACMAGVGAYKNQELIKRSKFRNMVENNTILLLI